MNNDIQHVINIISEVVRAITARIKEPVLLVNFSIDVLALAAWIVLLLVTNGEDAAYSFMLLLVFFLVCFCSYLIADKR